ncbi:hypothetical protein CAI16_19370 [Virgibacillus dokdonensis]|uniref:Uncharacterized protein n=1 Tax=Virgibacillus dokdonensis TaxID=302167 RepID=A0A3E0WJD2_9BACI|nr:hypothetical protein [Virgibacillus dokdonensis]RFA31975.1 hypothetical protein CAI16_19370 [Virgibacillus dokdonensis]
MRRKLDLVFGLIGALVLSIVFTNVLAKEQTDVSGEDKTRVVTVEGQDLRENKSMEGKDLETVITAEEQRSVENSSALSRYVSQENGLEFYFIKEQ